MLLLVGADIGVFALSFGPGYVVTVLHIVRACHTPRPNWRLLLWITSAIVQGAWMFPILLEIVRHGMDGSAFYALSFIWWVYAFLVSVVGVVADNQEAHEEQQKA
jgi:hypothetical protein